MRLESKIINLKSLNSYVLARRISLPILFPKETIQMGCRSPFTLQTESGFPVTPSLPARLDKLRGKRTIGIKHGNHELILFSRGRKIDHLANRPDHVLHSFQSRKAVTIQLLIDAGNR